MSRHRKRRMDEPTGAEKERLRKAYADRDVLVSDILRRFSMCQERLIALAVREGWPLRRLKAANDGGARV